MFKNRYILILIICNFVLFVKANIDSCKYNMIDENNDNELYFLENEKETTKNIERMIFLFLNMY